MLKFALLAGVMFAAVAQAFAAAPGPIVFFGDGYTAAWPLPSNYVNAGVPGFDLDGLTSDQAAAAFQAKVVSLHPSIVHIMIGSNNQSDDATYASNIPQYLVDIATMVKEAEAANIKVILGYMPPNSSGWIGPISLMNGALAAYGAANGIQVGNYYDALCLCVGSTGGTLSQPNNLDAPPTTAVTPAGNPGYLPTAAGYALMTQMAQTAIANLKATLKSGYLQDVTLPNPNDATQYTNQNTVAPGTLLQFTPIGYYSDGSSHPQLNSSYAGASGTWTTSNPQVMYVSQTGKATAYAAGTAIIKYTSPNGVAFSEWIMYVQD
jgi:hypothetical protein